MSEDFEFSWWQKIANKLGIGGVFAILGVTSIVISSLIGCGIIYAVIKFVVAH